MDRVAMLNRRMRGKGGIGPMQPGMFGGGKVFFCNYTSHRPSAS